MIMCAGLDPLGSGMISVRKPAAEPCRAQQRGGRLAFGKRGAHSSLSPMRDARLVNGVEETKRKKSTVSFQLFSLIQSVSLYPTFVHRIAPEGAPDREAAECEVSPDVAAGVKTEAPQGAPPSLDGGSVLAAEWPSEVH